MVFPKVVRMLIDSYSRQPTAAGYGNSFNFMDKNTGVDLIYPISSGMRSIIQYRVLDVSDLSTDTRFISANFCRALTLMGK
jgi:hypothetical protein